MASEQPLSQPLPDEPRSKDADVHPRGGSLKKKLLIVLALVVCIGGGAGVWYGVQKIMHERTAPVPSTTSNEAPPVPGDLDADRLTDDEEKAVGTDPAKRDTDSDGLIDSDEYRLYKTDPLKPDSDSDGLTDREEVYVWRSNPLNRDSDSDGYGDADEVLKGYNPMGDGILPQGY